MPNPFPADPESRDAPPVAPVETDDVATRGLGPETTGPGNLSKLDVGVFGDGGPVVASGEPCHDPLPNAAAAKKEARCWAEADAAGDAAAANRHWRRLAAGIPGMRTELRFEVPADAPLIDRLAALAKTLADLRRAWNRDAAAEAEAFEAVARLMD